MSTQVQPPNNRTLAQHLLSDVGTTDAGVASGSNSSSGVSYIRPGYDSLLAYLCIPGQTAKAIAWYEQAFGAKEAFRLKGRDGQLIVHAELQFGTSRFMLSDCDEYGVPLVTGNNVTMCFYTPDVDSLYQRALKAGAKSLSPPTTHFYGDRAATVQDIFGLKWSLMTHVKDVSPEEMQRLSYEMEDAMCAKAQQESGKNE